MKIVLDTNVIISRTFSPHGAPAEIIERWLQGSFELLVSAAILDEYRQTLIYPRIQQRIRIGAAAVDRLLADIASIATLVAPVEQFVGTTSDPDDDKFIACAVAGDADYIVSGDQHLLNLRTVRNIPIVTPAEFLVFLRS